MYTRVKDRTFEIMEQANKGDYMSRFVDTSIILLILVNVACVILETVGSMEKEYRDVFLAIDIASITVFSFEYCVRLWCCTSDAKYAHPIKGRVKYVFSMGALVDFVAIAPFFLPLVFKVDLRIMRLLRLLRIVRLLKLGRYSKALQRIGNVFWEKKEELGITLAFMAILLIVMSTVMFYVEHVAQPEAFSSIPATMWWGLATLTTVGYGDIYPITTLGKVLAGGFSLFGIAMFALPAGILSSGFSDMINGNEKEEE